MEGPAVTRKFLEFGKSEIACILKRNKILAYMGGGSHMTQKSRMLDQEISKQDILCIACLLAGKQQPGISLSSRCGINGQRHLFHVVSLPVMGLERFVQIQGSHASPTEVLQRAATEMQLEFISGPQHMQPMILFCTICQQA